MSQDFFKIVDLFKKKEQQPNPNPRIWWAYFSDWCDVTTGYIVSEEKRPKAIANSTAEFQVIDMSLHNAILQEKDQKIADLEAKLDWMTKKRWALEGAIADIMCMNSCYISSSSDDAVRKTHHRFEQNVITPAVKHAGGVTVYTTYGEKDYTYTPPCYAPTTKKE